MTFFKNLSKIESKIIKMKSKLIIFGLCIVCLMGSVSMAKPVPRGVLDTDSDLDGVLNDQDLCPEIPYRSESGCPIYYSRVQSGVDEGLMIHWFAPEHLFLHERAEMKYGDMFWAAILDPDIGQEVVRSNVLEVKH